MGSAEIAGGVTKLREALLPADACCRLIGLFYEDEGSFAGRSFLDLGPHEPDRITASDLLAVTFMGEIFPPLAVRQLLEGELRDEVATILRDIRDDLELQQVSDEELHAEGGPFVRLWRALMPLHNVAETNVSKLMARKRPALFPIYDSVIGEYIASVDDYWHVFRRFFDEADALPLVDELRSDSLPAGLPALRVLDTAVWMRYSGGRPALAARAKVGL